jgi:hypothetical protein
MELVKKQELKSRHEEEMEIARQLMKEAEKKVEEMRLVLGEVGEGKGQLEREGAEKEKVNRELQDTLISDKINHAKIVEDLTAQHQHQLSTLTTQLHTLTSQTHHLQ